MAKKTIYGGWKNLVREFFDLSGQTFEERCSGFALLILSVGTLYLIVVAGILSLRHL